MPLIQDATELPSSQQTIIEDQEGEPLIADAVDLPALRPGTVLVKITGLGTHPERHQNANVVFVQFAGILVYITEGTQTDLVLGDPRVRCPPWLQSG